MGLTFDELLLIQMALNLSPGLIGPSKYYKAQDLIEREIKLKELEKIIPKMEETDINGNKIEE